MAVVNHAPTGQISPGADTPTQASARPANIVVIGNGMVGQRFCERLVACDGNNEYQIITFCEEPRAAYDRVGLTSFFAHRDAEKLMLAKMSWYREHGIELHIGDRANAIDRQARVVRSDRGVEVAYDTLVLATGSHPFVPPIGGIQQRGVFLYRTVEDLEQIIAYSARAKRVAVLGGGLLGLEAAKAASDLGLETHVVELAPRLMPRQLDETGSRVLAHQIQALGVTVHLNRATEAVLGERAVSGVRFRDGTAIDVDMVIVSAGIRPRDELAKASGLEVGSRGGVVVNDLLQTSDPLIYAIGEVALHRQMTYGLVGPGYQMAEVVATHLTGGSATFERADLSTKLKLMGIDVATFGDAGVGNQDAEQHTAQPLTWEDPFAGVYKKLLFAPDGSRLLGGILVGDAGDYGPLSALARSGGALPCAPYQLLLGETRDGPLLGGVDTMPDAAQICSCNNVSKADICNAVRGEQLTAISQVKTATKAGTGCGGCMPLVTDLFNAEMKAAGRTVSNHLCEHFPYSRTELFALIKVKQLKTFDDILNAYGNGNGCEICKPTVASILASLWNETIIGAKHHTLQDTNDRFLANMQRGGLYSVVPRVPGGEITPEKLIVLGEVAKRYGLYAKITGGQRVDLFGAELHQLPEIWKELVAAGFESGHAYGKALRTVKSCVGTTWCRFGVQDAVGFAVRLENRYKGIRAPHKIKSAVSGCIRECAEAQSKDFGLVATEQGYNLYVCGNGGAKPRHADLLAANIDEPTAVRYIDRFLMYYISTADKLTRTAVWLDKLDGGIDHLKEVVIEDKLDICAELEAMMQSLVGSYRCEWTAVVNDPEKQRLFRQFVNTSQNEPSIERISERGQSRPADWPSESVSRAQVTALEELARTSASAHLDAAARPAPVVAESPTRWVQVGLVGDFPRDGGATIKYGKVQIAVFNFASRGQWYACQQMCPHKKAFVLSRGIIGDAQGTAKVACPLHKKTFSLESGACLTDEAYGLEVFPVKVEDEMVSLRLPPQELLDRQLATEIGCTLATSCSPASELQLCG